MIEDLKKLSKTIKMGASRGPENQPSGDLKIHRKCCNGLTNRHSAFDQMMVKKTQKPLKYWWKTWKLWSKSMIVFSRLPLLEWTSPSLAVFGAWSICANRATDSCIWRLPCSTELLTNRHSAFVQMMVPKHRNLENYWRKTWKFWSKSMIVSIIT